MSSSIRKSTRARQQILNSTIHIDSTTVRRKPSQDSDSESSQDEEPSRQRKTTLPRRRTMQSKRKTSLGKPVKSASKQTTVSTGTSLVRRKKPLVSEKRVPKDSDDETTESEESDNEQEQVRARPRPKIVQTVPKVSLVKPSTTAQNTISRKSESKVAAPVVKELWQEYGLPPPRDNERDTDEQGVQVYERIQLNKQKKLEAKMAKDKTKQDLLQKPKRMRMYLGAFLVVVFGSILVAGCVSKCAYW